MNFIIAILSDTYSKLSTQSLGIYYDGIISRIPVYEYDARYGGLIMGTPPMNVLAVPLLPVYFFVKNQDTLISLNDKFTRVQYLPLAIIFTAIFAVLNLCIVPFAYLSALIKKVNLALNRQERLQSELSKHTEVDNPFSDFGLFLLLGLPMLVVSALLDTLYFMGNLYRDDVKELGYETGLGEKEETVMTEA